MHDGDVPVLIAGGSLVGMTTATLLGRHGTRSLVVERHPGAAIHPRAALIMQRSMEDAGASTHTLKDALDAILCRAASPVA
jgi:2-polyprenyl-6-methoxyphenol hydroxylase-like FAD-dependent oxidoreductase